MSPLFTMLSGLRRKASAQGAVAPLGEDERVALRQTTVFCIVLVTGWALLAALHVWLVIYLRRFKLDSEDNLLARKHVTQTRILERIARTLIVLLTLSAALMTFDSVRQYGVGSARLCRRRQPGGWPRASPDAEESRGRRAACHHPADPHRRCAFRQRRVGQCRGNHLELCGHSPVGLAAHDRAAELFHRAALPELDA